MKENIAIKVNDRDNVATIFADNIYKRTSVEVRDKKGKAEVLNVIDDIPYGHKIALTDIAVGDTIIKYGESIGRASKPIKKGEYIHIHNLESMRGRGDL